MIKVVLCILFSIFLPLASWAQSDSLKAIWENENLADSLIFNALDEYYKINNQTQPDSTLLVLEYYYDLAESKKNTYQLFQASNGKGNIHRLKGNYDTAMNSYLEAEALAKELADSSLIAAVNGNMGNVFVYRQDYKQATQHFSKALKIYQKLGDAEGESHMLTSLGSVFLIINNYDLALEYYQKSLAILNKRGLEDRRTAIIYINIGWTNFEKKRYSEARNYYEKGLEILKVNNDKFFIADCYATLARIHLKQNELDKARDYALKYYELNKELGIETGLIAAEIITAQIEFETNLDEATKKGEAILLKIQPSAEKNLKMDLYELLYKCYKGQDKLDLSLKMYENFTIYRDSLQQEKNNFAVIREAVKNDFELQLHELELENQRTQSEIKSSQVKRIYVLSFVSLLVLGLAFWYFRSHVATQEKQKQKLLEEIERLKSAKPETVELASPSFELDREKLEKHIERKLNETDWSVLSILLEDPVISNKGIAEKAFLSVDGIGSSLRRMYQYFDIKESKYKKISLLMTAMKLSA